MANYYVATTGLDTNPGTIGQPWLTITKANTTLVAGDTVYIRTGTYSGQQINPTNAGTSGSRITYSNYGSETVTIRDVSTSCSISENYITVNGIRFDGEHLPGSDIHCWVLITGDYCIIQNCYGRYGDDYGGVWVEEASSYTQILNCEFGDLLEPTPSGETIRVEGDHVLIQGCTLYNGEHNCIGIMGDHAATTKYVIIKDNEFYSNTYRACGWGHEGDEESYVLMEGNTVHDIVTKLSPAQEYIADGIQTNSNWSIVRKNVFHTIDGAGIMLDSWFDDPYIFKHTYNKIYNNTIVDCGEYTGAPYSETNASIKIRYREDDDFPLGTFVGNAIKNNICYGSSRASIHWEYGVDSALDYYDVAGNWYDTDGDPLFTNAASHDYTLSASSSCINNGVFLTTITTANGSGTEFVVADAGYFCDGWDLVTGDTIQLEGQTTRVTVTDVNYATNTITVSASLTWTAGIGVALSYYGAAPDQGYYEAESALTISVSDAVDAGESLGTPSTQVGASATQAVTTGEAVAGYMFLPASVTDAVDIEDGPTVVSVAFVGYKIYECIKVRIY